MADEGFELFVKGREFRMVGNGVQRCVVTVVSLVLPDMDCPLN